MSPTSRNTLMIGGALILVALLLFCGPLAGRFGGGGQEIDQAPSVAAGPPEDPTDITEVADAAAVGAMVGATGAETGDAGLDTSSGEDEMPAVAVVAAGTAAAAAVAVAAESSGGQGNSGTGGESGLPSVSAGPPASTPVAALIPSDVNGAANDPAAATRAFDESTGELPGIGAAGSRFAPPVAAPGETSFAFAPIDGLGNDGVLRPCDSPGSGCRNLIRSSGPGRLPNPGLTSGGRRSVAP